MTTRAFPGIAAAVAAGWTGAFVALLSPAFAQGLPDGAGKELVRSACIDCHDLSPIVSAAFSRRQWEMVVQNMVDMGANIRGEEIRIVIDYLATSFPPKAAQ